jgi:hypothetical protein
MTTRRRPDTTIFAPSRHAKAASVRGALDEFVRDPGPGRFVVWMLAWRCKRCGYIWPVRPMKLPTGEVVKPNLKTPGALPRLPKKCPGCDSPVWWKDYTVGEKNYRRQKPRQPTQSAMWRALHPEHTRRQAKEEERSGGELEQPAEAKPEEPKA